MTSGVVEDSVEDSDDIMYCAACGTAGIDDIKLKDCSACKLVKYCGVKCQKDHRPQHKKECKKRAAELRDEILFKQPESSHWRDCPICCLPLSDDPKNSSTMACCCKVICDGCNYANALREREKKLGHSCPFCRQPAPASEEEAVQNLMKRVEANDPAALRYMGIMCHNEGNYTRAFAYLLKGAEFGDVDSHYRLSLMYHDGRGVEKDVKKEVYHLEEAAIGGHLGARYNLGYVEGKSGRHERAMNHFIIAAKLGCDDSLVALKKGFVVGLVSKEDFASALRAHQAAIDAMKSPQRDAVSAALK
eukprot:scaffold5664_cov94-Skeletonema_dohrnii-CCMP3373.AAC.4